MGQQLTLHVRVNESWSFVGRKKQPRWLWWLEDADTSQIVGFWPPYLSDVSPINSPVYTSPDYHH